MNKKLNYLAELKRLITLEYGCKLNDIDGDKNIITASLTERGGRKYSDEGYFFHMVTLGGNAVITADQALHEFLHEYTRERKGTSLFEQPSLLLIEHELNKHGYKLTKTYHMFLPVYLTESDKVYSVKWFRGEEINRFYGDERFPNAICEKPDLERPDTITVCAYDGDIIMGMAGCSRDYAGDTSMPAWQQIGIDVLPAYRSIGVGTYLVTLLRDEIIKIGNIPFYGTNLSNLHSWNIALNCGFRPAWVEIGADKLT